MPELPSNPAVMKLHEAFNSLNVTLAYIQLSQRRLMLRERAPYDDQLLSNLHSASNRLLVAVAQLRDAEAILTAEQPQTQGSPLLSSIDGDTRLDGTANAEPDSLEREDDDAFFDSEEGSEY